jgi:hypothetical protein
MFETDFELRWSLGENTAQFTEDCDYVPFQLRFKIVTLDWFFTNIHVYQIFQDKTIQHRSWST